MQKVGIGKVILGLRGGEMNEKIIKTLICIEGVTASDFMEDMDMRTLDGKEFTQDDAKTMQLILVDIYHLAHNIVASCCRNSHDKLLEKVYGSLIETNYISKDSLEKTVVELSQPTSHKKGK